MSPNSGLPTNASGSSNSSSNGGSNNDGCITGTGQTPQLALLRLMQIVSQGSPTGAFSYSQGLEWAVETGWIYDIHTFESWVREQLQGMLAQQELPLMLRFYRAFEACVSEARALDPIALDQRAINQRSIEQSSPEQSSLEQSSLEPDALAPAAVEYNAVQTSAVQLNPLHRPSAQTYAFETEGSKRVAQLEATVLSFRETSELRDEERKRGQAMARLVTQLNSKIKFAGGGRGNSCDCQLSVFTEYCVVEGIDVLQAMHGYAFAWLENQVMAGIKLVPLGQTSGQQVLYRLTEKIDQCVVHAQSVLDDDIGYSSPALAMASSQHETQYSRLFRS